MQQGHGSRWLFPVLLLVGAWPAWPVQAAAPDGNIEWDGVFADLSPDFVSPAQPGPDEPVTLRLQARKDDLTGVRVRVWDEGQGGHEYWLELARAPVNDRLEVWSGQLPGSPSTKWWYFELKDGPRTAHYYATTGMSDRPPEQRPEPDFQLRPGLTTPAWVREAVFYQIFPDRFRDGDWTNNVRALDGQSGEYCYGEDLDDHSPAWAHQHACWYEVPDNAPGGEATRAYSVDFYGGDLQGVREQLGYLEQLASAIYLNPIFMSRSNHKYDTEDYRCVDPHFGGNVALRELLAAAHARGVRVVLDGVFNHSGESHYFFDRCDHACCGQGAGSRHPGEEGAYESRQSPFAGFYTFEEHGWPEHYCAWAGFGQLPKLNFATPAVRSWLYGDGLNGEPAIARRWLDRFGPHGIDGWRLDVPSNAGPFCDGGDDSIWLEFRRAVKQVSPDAVIIGEIWDDASHYLKGDMFDAVMNYDGFAEPVSRFLTGLDVRAEQRDASALGSVSRLDARLRQTRLRHPYAIAVAQYNLLDSHDISRLLRRTKGVLREEAGFGDADGERPERLRVGTILLYTYLGPPSVYYGSEVGLSGASDPDNRRTFPWDPARQDRALLELHRQLYRLRRSHPALTEGSFFTLGVEDGARIYVYGRTLGPDRVAVALNVGEEPREVRLPVWRLGWTDGVQLTDCLTGDRYPIAEGEVRLPALAAWSGAVLAERCEVPERLRPAPIPERPGQPVAAEQVCERYALRGQASPPSCLVEPAEGEGEGGTPGGEGEGEPEGAAPEGEGQGEFEGEAGEGEAGEGEAGEGAGGEGRSEAEGQEPEGTGIDHGVSSSQAEAGCHCRTNGSPASASGLLLFLLGLGLGYRWWRQ